MDKPIYSIVGPTASGKTKLGVDLALRVGGEIINCDSVQIYKEIEIATAKPSEEEKRGVPHHLIGYIPPRNKLYSRRLGKGRRRKDRRDRIAG